MHQEIDLVGEGAGECAGVRVFFVPSRTSVTHCGVRGLVPGAQAVSMHFSGRGVDVRWEPRIYLPARIVLSVEIEGEPLSVARLQWRDGAGHLVASSPDGFAAHAFVGAEDGSTADFAAYARAMCALRYAAILARPDPVVRKYSLFFYDLDVQTNETLISCANVPEVAVRLARMSVVEEVLFYRIIARARWEVKNPGTPPRGLPTPEREHVLYLSRLLLVIIRRNLPGPEYGMNVDELWSAFEKFANGEIRVSDACKACWNGEPDGAHLFSFAEFAWLAHDLDVDRAEWLRILPVFVAIQEIYLRAYRRGENARRRFESYTRENWSRDHMVDDAFKEELRKRFAGVAVERLTLEAGRIAASALGDH